MATLLSPTGSRAPLTRAPRADALQAARGRPSQAGARLVETFRTLPPRRGTRELMLYYREVPMLRAVANKLATMVSEVSWFGAARVSETREIEPVWDDHPINGTLSRGNALMTGESVRKTLALNYLLAGEAFEYLVRNAWGVPVERYVIPSHWVQELPVSPDDPFVVQVPSGHRWEIPRVDVVMHRDPDPYDPYGRGSGAGMALAGEMETDASAAAMMNGLFENSGVPGMLVSPKPSQSDVVETISERDLKTLEAKWKRFAGADNAGKAAFLSTPMEVLKVQTSFADAQVQQLREFVKLMVVHAFACPPEIIGIIDNSNRATIDAAEHIAHRTVIVPLLRAFQSAYQDQLAGQYDDALIPEFENPVQEDRAHQLAMVQAAPYAFSVDEIRAMGGLGALPDRRGEVHAKQFGFAFDELHPPGRAPLPIQLPTPQPNPTGQVEDAGVGGPAAPAETAPAQEEGPALLAPPTAEDLPSAKRRRKAPASCFLDYEGGRKRHRFERASPPPENDDPGRYVSRTEDEIEEAFAPYEDALGRYYDSPAGVGGLAGDGVEDTEFAIDRNTGGGVNGRGSKLILFDALRRGLSGVVAEFGEQAMNDFDITLTFGIRDDTVENWIAENALERASKITETTRKNVRKVLARAVGEGMTFDNVKAEVSRVYSGTTDQRVRTIVATETTRAAAYATQTALKQAKIEQKMWVATRDDRVRETHAGLDGQVRDIDDEFDSSSGARALHPGEFGVAGEDINCRCFTVPVFPEGHPYAEKAAKLYGTRALRAAYYKSRESVRAPVERTFAAIMASAFERDRAGIIDELAIVYAEHGT